MNVVILNPVLVEYEATRSLLNEYKECTKHGRSYLCSTFKNKSNKVTLLIRQAGSGISNITLATEKAIQDWKPAMLLLVGIAGSIKDADFGDLVIATKSYGYESGKETPTGFSARPDVIPTSPKMLELSRVHAEKKEWLDRLPLSSSPCKVFFGPIASGEKVIANTASTSFEIIKKHYNDTLAVEMEAIGFARACLHHPLIQHLNIRGISDRIDGKAEADAAGMQHKAATNAAAFAFELLHNLNFFDFNIVPMQLKNLVKEIFALIFPIIKMEASQKIGKEFSEATNTTIMELWSKVKPLFIEEFEDLKLDTSDEDAQGAVRHKLRKVLTDKEELQKELTALVNLAKSTPQGGMSISKGKNIVQGSNISVGGNLHIGDKKRK